MPSLARATTDLPKQLASLAEKNEPFIIDEPGKWIILSDVHIPHHDEVTVNTALARAKKVSANGILLNGDIIDCGEISRHDKHRSSEKYTTEIKMGGEFLAHVRRSFPKARIVYKLGNHEERHDSYTMSHAPAFEHLEGFDIPSLLHFVDFGIEFIKDRRVIKLGDCHVLHGHEFGGGGGGVNVARWLYLRCGGGVAAACGHFHRSSEHHERNLTGFHGDCWSIGCACDLNPFFLAQNKWNHGFAEIEILRGGRFSFSNFRVFPGGQIY